MDCSLILYGSLEGSSFYGLDLKKKTCHEWMKSFCRISAINISSHEAHIEALLAALIENEVEIACCMGVISNGYFGFFDLLLEEAQETLALAQTC